MSFLKTDPAKYDAWYRTPRGKWIGETEFAAALALTGAKRGDTVLDIGCGTGYFSRMFSGTGAKVTGTDIDTASIAYAKEVGKEAYLTGSALALPFKDRSFDYSMAMTSLCFVDDPVAAIKEALRVSRHGVLLGLLNKNSALYLRKHGRGGYAGARWDSAAAVKKWLGEIDEPLHVTWRHAIVSPSGGFLSRMAEKAFMGRAPFGGFMAVMLRRGQEKG